MIIDEKSGGQNIKPGKEFKRPKRSSKNVQSTSATTTNISQNCFSVLEDSIAENPIHVELELNGPEPDEASDAAFDNSVIVKSVKESNESRASKHDEIKMKDKERMLNRTNTGKNPTKKHRSVIIGDSIVKGLDQYKLSRSTKQNIGARCFPGATIQDMRNYLKPILRRNPDRKILHVGTNDAKHNKAKKIMDDIDSLCQEIKDTNPEIEIILSGLTTREDNPQAGQTVTEVNTMLENYCEATNMHLITHENITSRSLNKSKLHLNRYGSANLTKNFKYFFNQSF